MAIDKHLLSDDELKEAVKQEGFSLDLRFGNRDYYDKILKAQRRMTLGEVEKIIRADKKQMEEMRKTAPNSEASQIYASSIVTADRLLLKLASSKKEAVK